ncbi:MAG TPA: GNAT family N-acetyltransferase [Ktedonobacterales bacterium]|jgi:hypothetical protein
MEPDFEHITVRDNQAEQRYEAQIDQALAVLEYDQQGQRITLIHTEVPSALEGHGIAGKLTRFALDDARARRLEVIPVCPFVVSYLRRHPADLDVVAPAARTHVTDGQH